MKKALVIGDGVSGRAACAALSAGGWEVDTVAGYGLVVASPGVPVASELAIGVRRLCAAGVRLLAVTGSKGKSSVVKLLSEALELAGYKAVACGNYGLPVSAVQGVDWAVVEVSSFQLETTVLPPDAFVAAAILNLQADHLDRHGSLAVYHALKRRLLAMAPVGIDASVEGFAVAGAERLFAGSYFDNGVLRRNGAVAVALLRAAGIDDATIARAFAAFRPLPHRFETVAEHGGVRYIDDSKATSLAAVAAALGMCDRPVRLIAGGLPKGDDPQMLLALLTNRVKKVYLIGTSAQAFAAAWSGAVECALCGTLEVAAKMAMSEARPGESVLLSPGTASFDQFESFEARGEAFASLVKKEGR